MKTPKIPTYGHHKPTGQARCYVNGKTVYLVKYGSEESRIRFGEIVGKLIGGQIVDPIARVKVGSTTCGQSDDPGPSVGELCLVFLRHAETHYLKDGKQTSEVHILKSVIAPPNQLYGMLPAKDFGPLALKAVRAKMVELSWCRDTINAAMSRISRIFKHAIANELIDSAVLDRLKCVAPLLAGRTEAHDNAPRSAVSPEDIETIRKSVSAIVRDLIDVQRLTGTRSGELLKLTTGTIDRSGEVWVAELSDHKMRHHGKSRTLHFGPHAQLILTKYLSANPDERLFKITGAAYRRSITRACEKLSIDRWVPHQLRHTNADVVREEFGLEHTQAVLGYAKAHMSEHSAKASRKKAAEVARKIG